MLFEEIFIQAINERKLCKMTDKENKERIVEPYMMYLSSKRHLNYHCYQTEGFSETESTGWKNISSIDIKKIEIIDDKPVFKVRDEYNPFNKKFFPIVVYAIPTNDGRKRLPLGITNLFL